MSMEMGKPFAEAKGEVAYGAEFLRWFSEEAPRIYGRYSTAPDGKNRLMVLKKPVGPALLITPWNFPLAMATRKIAPAIAAGCTMVLKPAALTPLTSQLFATVLEDLGLPKGVLNVITTTNPQEVTGPLIKDDRLRKLSFTGSTPVGRKLIADSAHQVLRVSMELGGNAPFLVFEDADIDKAVEGAMLAKLRNMGEACTAANRFIVHESVADEFGQKLSQRMSALKVGRGLDEGSNIGPLIEERARQGIHALVEDAKSKGAKVLLGGRFLPVRVTSTHQQCWFLSQRAVTFCKMRSLVQSHQSAPSRLRPKQSRWRITPSMVLSPMPSPKTSTEDFAWPRVSRSACLV
ncbi:hypothetical protein AKACHI_01100 [Aquiluna sp. KACHI24]|nr:hypothetical protein AKACHI_01100 [Aquiluna sp. KACHI24]